MSAATPHVLRLEPELTIYGAAALREHLAAALDAALAGASPDGGAALALDLADVWEIDSAGLQLLMAARRDADARGLDLCLHGPGAAVREALALFGLDEQARPLAHGERHGT